MSFDELKHEEWFLVFPSNIVNGDDVWMVEFGYRLRLGHETRICLSRRNGVFQHLNGDDTVQSGISGLKYDALSTFTQLLQNSVSTVL